MSNAELRQAALLISSLEPSEAAGLVARLEPHQVAALTTQLGKHATFTDDERRALLTRLEAVASSAMSADAGARQAIASSPGLNDIASSDCRAPFAVLRHVGARQLSAALVDEHPQTIAMVLSHLPAPESAQVLARLNAEVARGVTRRLAAILPAATGVIDDVQRGLERRLARLRRQTPA